MTWRVYKHLLGTYGRKPGIWFALFTEIIRSLITRVLIVVLLADMAAHITTGNIEQAKHNVILYLLASLGAIVLISIGELVGHHTENVVYGEQQHAYYKKLTRKDMSFYRDNHTGYLTVMLRQYVDSSIILVRLLKGNFVRIFISLTVPIFILFRASTKIGLIVLVLVVTQILYMIWASAKTKKYRKATNEIYRQISAEIADDITNISAYKAAGREEESEKRMISLRIKEMHVFWQRRKIQILLDAPRSVVSVCLGAAAYWVVLNTPYTTQESITLTVLTLTYMIQITRIVTELPDLVNQHDDLVSKLDSTLDTFSNTHEEIADPIQPAAYVNKGAAIEIKDLVFAYDKDKSNPIFQNLSIAIGPGEHVGIVGLSGAGKSTLASLLMRFDDIQSGSISIDGVDIRHINQSELRQNIAYVPQEPILFHRSIKENIAYHAVTPTNEAIERAAKAAHAHEFISSLPNGYDTLVGERGVKLSGGQKQRIVIARAVLKNAPIILFDEATSALDSESEHIIQQALPGIIGKHTAVIIAHRLSTVAGLDRIIVMHKGAIEEQGTHKQLLQNKGRYYSLWQKQINHK